MDRRFTNENLEQFLRQSTDSLRMRPGEKVWKSISADLKRRQRRVGYLTGIFIMAITALGYYLTGQSNKMPLTAKLAGNQNSTLSSSNSSSALTDVQNQKIVLPPRPYLAWKKPATETLHHIVASGKPLSGPALHDEKNNLTSIPENNLSVTYPIDNTPDFIDRNPSINGSIPGTSLSAKAADDKKTDIYPYTKESVLNSYSKNHNKIKFQISFAPTISYRKLSENKDYMRSVPLSSAPYNYTAIYNAALYNINDMVTDKPDMGFELGGIAKYALSKDIKLTAGLQFNFNRYAIKAFNSYTGVATIALNSGYRVDSLRALTSYSNTNNGNGPDWVQNFYVQLSAPVGIEIKLRGDDKVQLGIATSFQPTYVLGNRSYVISSDYKNYANVPWLTRKWNVNTSFQTYVAYSTGHLTWQVGPQIRYQLMSSFIQKYPVKENLFDFGFKVGISINH